MGVPLLDLTAQYASIKAELDEAVARVVGSQNFVLGPEVEALEAELAAYLGVRHAVGCASGTDALLLPLMSLRAEPGDEVVLPAFTFFATAGAVWNAGFKPVFCDVDAETFNVTPGLLESVLSDRTRAVIPVHLFGQMAPVEAIREAVQGSGALVLEDAAQAIGATRQIGGEEVHAGAAGDAAAFSFFPTKNLGAFGEGGLVTTDSDELADQVRKLRVHGGLQMYHHQMVGTNSRLHALQAAVLRVKLPHLDAWTAARRRNAALYDEAFEDVAEVITPHLLSGNTHVYNLYTMRVRRRDELRRHLTEAGIGSGVYYPVPMHLQECFASLGVAEGELPVSEGLSTEVISLPVFPELGEDRVALVCDAIREFYE